MHVERVSEEMAEAFGSELHVGRVPQDDALQS
jgi:hypothetical protein